MINQYPELNFELPDELIARFPSEKRDLSRLMIINRKDGSIKIEPFFKEVKNYLNKKDILVFNSTRVSKRRVYLIDDEGREFECIFLENLINEDISSWKCLVKNQKKLKKKKQLFTSNTTHSFTISKFNDFTYLVPNFEFKESFFEEYGNIPIPPYLKRKAVPEDNNRYQTIFANNTGSVAAPTAGLHFTEELKNNLKENGIHFKEIELKIGYGTFGKLTEKNFTEKKLHSEEYIISSETSNFLNENRVGGRVISIGTTSLRALESSYDKKLNIYNSYSGNTELFILPDDKVYSIDGLITNFHLPGSSLLMLVSAFCGKDLLMKAYHLAVKEKMRFFSYGDSMLIL